MLCVAWLHVAGTWFHGGDTWLPSLPTLEGIVRPFDRSTIYYPLRTEYVHRIQILSSRDNGDHVLPLDGGRPFVSLNSRPCSGQRDAARPNPGHMHAGGTCSIGKSLFMAISAGETNSLGNTRLLLLLEIFRSGGWARDACSGASSGNSWPPQAEPLLLPAWQLLPS